MIEEIKEEEKVEDTSSDEEVNKAVEEDGGSAFKLTSKRFWVRTIAQSAIFGAIACILYCVPFLKLKLPIFGFLEFHFDDIPALLAGFAYGPITSVLVILIRTLVKLPMTSTLCVGELSDLIYSLALVLPAVLIYRKKRNMKGVWIGFAVGFVVEVALALLCNGLFMMQFYMDLYGIGMNVICGMFSQLKVTDMKSLLINAILPFNVIKNFAIILVTFVIYKPLHRLISKIPYIG